MAQRIIVQDGNIVLSMSGVADLLPISPVSEVTLSVNGQVNVAGDLNVGTNALGPGIITSAPSEQLSIYAGAGGNLSLSASGAGVVLINGLAWPSTDGTVGQVLTTNGSGTLSWSASSAVPGGPTGAVQFNVGGFFAGNTDFTHDPTTGLTISASGGVILDSANQPSPSFGFNGPALLWGPAGGGGGEPTGRPNIYGYNDGVASTVGIQINGQLFASLLVEATNVIAPENYVITDSGTGPTPAGAGGALIWGTGAGRPNIYGYNSGASSAIGFQLNGQSNASLTVTTSGIIVPGTYTDSTSSVGTSGQVLTSTGTGTQWAPPGGGSYVTPYITYFDSVSQLLGAEYYFITATTFPSMLTLQASPGWSYDGAGGHLVNTSLTEDTWFEVTITASISAPTGSGAPWYYQFQYGTFVAENAGGATYQTAYVTPGWTSTSVAGALQWVDIYQVKLNSSQTTITPATYITQITQLVPSQFEITMQIGINKIGN
jgi:hypothetical protein